MSQIQIIEKPDWVTWEDIRECIHKAHEENMSNGVTMGSLKLSADELEARMNKDALNTAMYVILDGEKLVGTGGIGIYRKKRWCYDGKVGHLHYGALLPEYRGQRLYPLLVQKRYDFAIENGCDVIEFNTAEKNTRLQEIYRKEEGVMLVDFEAPASGNLYYVFFAKWLRGCPYSKFHIKLHYLLKKAKVKLLYKPGHIRRFRKR